jgi:hypothetical protein
MLTSASAIIEQSWLVYTKYWKRLFVYMAFLFLPTLVLFFTGMLSVYTDRYLPITDLASNIIIFIIFVVGLLFSFWVSLALTLHLKAIVKNEPQLSWQEYMHQSSPLILRSIAVSALVLLAIVGGGILLVIPGLIFIVWYAFALYFVLFENKGPINAMGASKKLVTGRWFAIIWRLVIPSLLFLAAFRIAELVILVPSQYVVSVLTVRLITRIVDGIAGSLVAPLTIIPVLILYFSAKENPVTENSSPTNQTV